MRTIARRTVAALPVCCCAIALFAYAHGQSGNPLQQSVANAEKLVTALQLYTQDWDERFPRMKTQPEFQAALTGYVSNRSVFLCSITRQPFQPNAALSRRTWSIVRDSGSTPAVSAALPDMAPLVAYLDGHVQQGNTDLTDPTLETVHNAKRLGLGLLMYVEDYDETFPLAKTPDQFQQALFPYVRDHHAFRCPLSGKPFRFNPQLIGVSLAAITDFATTPALWDYPAQPNSQSVVTYFPALLDNSDFYVERGGVDLSDPILEGDSRIGSLINGLNLYAAWNQEVLPPTDNAAVFKQAVYPYVQSDRDFLSPFSLQPYTPNPKISGRSLNSIKDLSVVKAVEDLVPASDGKIMIGYLDGSITRDGVDQGDPTYDTQSHAETLMQALQQYLQAHNNLLPPMATFAQFKAALFPYVRASRAFTCPYNHTVFAVNIALNGHSFLDFSDPSKVVVIQDPEPERDGRHTVGYLNGNVGPARWQGLDW